MLPPNAPNTFSFKSKLRIYLSLLFIPVCFLALLSYYDSKKIFIEKTKFESQKILKNIQQSYIEKYIFDLEHCIEILKSEVDVNRLNSDQYRSKLINNWEYYKKFNKDIWYVYIGTSGGDIFTYPGWDKPIGYDPKIRPWYIQAEKQTGDIAWVKPYKEYSSDDMILSIVSALTDVTGDVKGVISIDTKLETLSGVISEINSKNDSHVYITDLKGNMVAQAQNTPPLTSVVTNKTFNKVVSSSEGVLYSKDKSLFTAFTTIQKPGWKLIAIIPDKTINSYLGPVTKRTIIAVYCSLVFFVAIAFLMERRLEKEYDTLKKCIHLITGDGSDKFQAKLTESNIYRSVYKNFDSTLKTISDIKHSAITDSLTGLYDRGYIMERVDSMSRRNLPFSILLFDIDNFKLINDTYGHHVGDSVLEKTSGIIRDHIRPIDIAGRYGGEEFIIILRETSLGEAREVGNRIRKAFLRTQWGTSGLNVSISGGVAENTEDMDMPILHLADSLMYRAKKNGKNRIETDAVYAENNRLV